MPPGTRPAAGTWGENMRNGYSSEILKSLFCRRARNGAKIVTGLFSPGAINHSLSCRRCRKGFSLTELIIILAIVSSCLLFIIPVVKEAAEKDMRVQCAENLRNSGIAYQMYASDHGGLFPLAVHAAAPPHGVALRRGLDMLGALGYIDRSSNATLCPSWPPYRYGGTNHRYAIVNPRQEFTEYIDGWFEDTHEAGGRMQTSSFIDAKSLKRPDDFVFLLEATRRGDAMQWITWNPTADHKNPHFRHGGLMNVFFAGGHVESVDEKRFTEAYRKGNYAAAEGESWKRGSTRIYVLPGSWKQYEESKALSLIMDYPEYGR